MDMDKMALESSDIFKEYLKIQRMKDIQKKKATEVDEDEVLTSFAVFERDIRKDPKKLRAFRALQEKFTNDLEYREAVNPLFVEGVMMLNLGGQE